MLRNDVQKRPRRQNCSTMASVLFTCVDQAFAMFENGEGHIWRNVRELRIQGRYFLEVIGVLHKGEQSMEVKYDATQ